MRPHRNVDIRLGLPHLYWSVMVAGAMCVLLGLNFWFSTPTFRPLGIPNEPVGVAFFMIGAGKLWFLNFTRNLYVIRLLLGLGVSFFLFWGMANMQQSFAGRASFQLPILYFTIALLQLPLLRESFVNAMREDEHGP